MMNDETYYNKKRIREEWNLTLSQDDPHRAGIQFARRVRLARAVGLAAMFFPVAGMLVTHFLPGGWWLLLVGWAFVWPHFAWQLSCRAASPHQQEIFNLKIDAIIAGLWIGVMGMNALPTAALVMMVGMNMMGSGAVVCLSRGSVDSALRAGDAAARWARGRLQPRPRGVELNASRTGALSHAVCLAQPPHRRQACGT
jgi:hypothetical protein